MQVPQTEVVLRGADGAELIRTVLPPGEYVIGRHPDCALHVEAELVSRQHARLTINFDHLLIEDLASSNGTSVNGQSLSGPTRLWPNQKVQLGTATMNFRRVQTVRPPEVSLAPSAAAVQRLLPPAFLREQKYDIGGVIAQGGMGAILDAREATIERKVAMKVMLDGNSADDLTRFIGEAKITGQLEHPSIVPIYELGVDENEQVFYTMKFVQGITLRKVLDLMAEGAEATLKKYPLGALLTIFQKVCDAVAFAHAKGVIHRDLKPENIMLGDFGEVLVMDWGLAKLVGQSAQFSVRSALRPRAQGRGAQSGKAPASDTGHSALSTLQGTIMGTPQYMAPEQARGEVETMDQRADIYALGAILYHLLALRPSVTGDDAMLVVTRVATGDIDPLTAARGRALPDSLAAVCRHAMAIDAAARYPSVPALQADIQAFQNGFATSAEKAGAWKQLKLFVARNQAVSIAVAAALVLLAGVSSVYTSHVVRERRRAEQALADLKRQAPALLELAESEAGFQRFPSALKKVDAALALDPTLPTAYWRRGWLLLAQERLPETLTALQLAAKNEPNSQNTRLIPIVEKMAATPAAERHSLELMRPLYEHLSAAGALGESLAFLPHLNLARDARYKVVNEHVIRWLGKSPGNAAPPVTQIDQYGRVRVSVSGLRLPNLDPLRGLPIEVLLANNCGLTSLEALRGMPLYDLTVLAIQSRT